MYYLPKDEVKDLDIDKYLEIHGKLSSIDKDNLAMELVKHTTVYSYYHGMLIWQKRKIDIIAANNQALYSLLKNSELEANKNKGSKATATYLEDYAQSNDEYIKAKTNLIYQEEIYGYLRAICSMLEHKKDMLVQLSANLRSETKLYN
jgi:hypothetical protein